MHTSTLTRGLALFTGLALLTPSLLAQEPERDWNIRVYGFAEDFQWEEFFDGQRILQESGALIGAGLNFDDVLAFGPTLIGYGEFYIGDVDYDGGLQDGEGEITPFTSETSYVGGRGQVALAFPLLKDQPVGLAPFAGFGANTWTRSLDTEIFDNDVGQYGYEEYWFSLYAVLGARVSLSVGDRTTVFASGQVNQPLFTMETVDLSDSGGPDDISLEPDNETGWEAEAGIQSGRFWLAAFYSEANYGESDVEDGVLQPESEARIAGGRIGIAL